MITIRSIKIFLLAATILFLAGTYFLPVQDGRLQFQHSMSGSLQSLSVGATTYDALKESRTEATLTQPAIQFNGYFLFFDRPGKRFYYSMVAGTSGSIDPAVSVAHGAPGYGVAFLESPITAESIRGNARHPFILYNDTHYAEYFFTVTTLPVVSLESNHPEYSPDSFISSKKSAVRMTLFDNRQETGHVQRVIVSEADVKTRGQTSLKYPQKSYRLSLSYVSLGHNKRKNSLSLLGMRTDDDWILYAPYNDPDKVRNIFAHNLWWEWGADNNAFGVKNGSQGRFVELFINGQYQGLHGLMQPVDAVQLHIQPGSSLATNEYLYRKIRNTNAVEQDLYKRGYRYVSGGFELLAPKRLKAAPEKWTPLANFLHVLGGPEEIFRAKYPEMVDLDNAIDVWLFTNVITALDNTSKNLTYVAKWTGKKHLMLFSPWDLDISFGMQWTGDLPLLTQLGALPDRAPNFELELPASRALTDNVGNAREKTKKRYLELRNSLLSDANMAKRVATCEADIFGSGAYLRNREKWPNAACADTIDAFEAYVMARLAFMDSVIAGL